MGKPGGAVVVGWGGVEAGVGVLLVGTGGYGHPAVQGPVNLKRLPTPDVYSTKLARSTRLTLPNIYSPFAKIIVLC